MAVSAFAQDIEGKKQRLDDLRIELQDTKQQHNVAQARIRRLEEAIGQEQRRIVAKAAEITRIERELLGMQREVRGLFDEEAEKSAALTKRKSEIAQMISSAWTVHHRPQLAAFMLPDDARTQALTARTLHMTTVALKQDMDATLTQMQELARLRETIVMKQGAIREQQAKVEQERADLQQALQARSKQLAGLKRDDKQHLRQMEKLRRQTSSLRELIATLEAKRAADMKAYAHIRPITKPGGGPRYASAPARPKPPSFREAKGVLALPARGVITGKFGEKRGANDRLKGIEMRALPGAMVSTPYEGEVLFTGPFLEYGKMVIIRHSRDYHTLIAGLDTIHVTLGQFLLDAEPIGVMGQGTETRTLYLELRHRSKAVDPAPWFALKKHHYASR